MVDPYINTFSNKKTVLGVIELYSFDINLYFFFFHLVAIFKRVNIHLQGH